MAQHFFASCPTGLEAVLAKELVEIGAQNVAPARGGVAFEGGWAVCYRANLWSRIASRILWRISTHSYRSEDEVYRHCQGVAWGKLFRVGRTLRVNVSAMDSPLRSLDFITLKIKDAICDRFRQDMGERPSISTSDPDVRVHAFFEQSNFTLYLDTSGEALFKRGYRLENTEAPLRENLAAGMLALSGWTPDQVLLDPMCGSGTILMEAALIARGLAPGRQRAFGFEKLMSFDPDLWKRIRSQGQAAGSNAPAARIFGSDRDRRQVDLTRKTFYAMGLEDAVELECVDVLERSAPAPVGVMVTNPPYGVRLETAESLANFYPQLGTALKRHFAGWTAHLFTADMEFPKRLGLKPSKRTPLFNGALECRLFEIKLIAGTMRRKAAAAD